MNTTIATSALILDCDGTLCDTEGAYMASFNATLLAHAPDAQPLSPSEWGREYVGLGLEKDAQLAVERYNLSCSAGKFLAENKHKFSELVGEPGSIAAFPGFDDLYTQARKRELKVAVASSSDKPGLHHKLMNGVLWHSQVARSLDAFDAILSVDDVQNGKPDPEIYLVTARLLGVDPASCWVVEDTVTGVLAGKRAGMRVAAVPNTFTQSHDFSGAGADVVCKSMADVVGLL